MTALVGLWIKAEALKSSERDNLVFPPVNEVGSIPRYAKARRTALCKRGGWGFAGISILRLAHPAVTEPAEAGSQMPTAIAITQGRR